MRYGEGLQEEIRRRTDLVQLVGRRVKLIRKGRMMWGCCPFHAEKSPSFKVDNERRAYKCFGCGAGGDAFKWLVETEGLTFEQTVERLARDVGVSLVEEASKRIPLERPISSFATSSGKAVFISYSHADEQLKDELLTHLSILRREGLVSVWHDRMLRPGELLDNTIEAQLASSDLIILLISASFLNSDYCSQKEMVRAFKRHHEGNADVLAVILRPCQWQTMPVQPRGKLGDFVALPKDAKPITSFPDHDFAWSQVVSELRHFLSKSSKGDLQKKDESGLVKASTDDHPSVGRSGNGHLNQRGLRPLHESLLSVVNSAEAAFSGRFFNGLATGFSEIDSALGGLRKSNLVLVAGRPGIGVSSLVTDILANTLSMRRRTTKIDGPSDALSVAMYSLDMSAEQFSRRLLSASTGIPLWKIRNGKFTEPEWEEFVLTMQDISTKPLSVSEGPIQLDYLLDEARKYKQDANLGLLIIDGLERLCGWSAKGDELEYYRVAHDLKDLAVELDIPILITSSLPNEVDERKPPVPQLSDLTIYNGLERFCDVVMFVFRKAHYLAASEPEIGSPRFSAWMEEAERAHRKADIVIAKNRNGSCVTVPLVFDSGVYQNLLPDEL